MKKYAPLKLEDSTRQLGPWETSKISSAESLGVLRRGIDQADTRLQCEDITSSPLKYATLQYTTNMHAKRAYF